MSLTYDAQSDRLDGGIFRGELQGRPILQMVLSMRRAKALFEAGKELKVHYDGLEPAPWASTRPFSEALAVLQLESFPVMHDGQRHDIPIDALFEDPALADAPPEYRDLCLMTLAVPEPGPQAGSGPEGPSPPEALARQLFRTLGCAHGKAHMTFTRQTGTCLEPGRITPGGEVLDIYYLTRSSESKARFGELCKADTRLGLTLAVDAAGGDGPVAKAVLEQARDAYLVASGRGEHGPVQARGRAGDAGDLRQAIESLVEELIGP